MVEYASERRDSMIEKFSKQITSHLILKDVIQSETAEVYRYGIELVISTFIGIILVLLCGLIFDMFWLTVLYYVIFFIIRRFAGGYHANTYMGCKVVLVVSTIMVLGITKSLAFLKSYSLIIHILLLIFSISTLIQLSPIDNENKPLDTEQEKRCNLIVSILSITFAVISLPLYYLKVECACIIALTLVLIAVMQIVEFSRRGVNKMSNSNKFVLKSVAKLAKSAARRAYGAASFFDFHQPKEPAHLKAMLNDEKKN